jgi:ADP-ribose pyrophosphatase YjhB (NUDIX family)
MTTPQPVVNMDTLLPTAGLPSSWSIPTSFIRIGKTIPGHIAQSALKEIVSYDLSSFRKLETYSQQKRTRS